MKAKKEKVQLPKKGVNFEIIFDENVKLVKIAFEKPITWFVVTADVAYDMGHQLMVNAKKMLDKN